MTPLPVLQAANNFNTIHLPDKEKAPPNAIEKHFSELEQPSPAAAAAPAASLARKAVLQASAQGQAGLGQAHVQTPKQVPRAAGSAQAPGDTQQDIMQRTIAQQVREQVKEELHEVRRSSAHFEQRSMLEMQEQRKMLESINTTLLAQTRGGAGRDERDLSGFSHGTSNGPLFGTSSYATSRGPPTEASPFGTSRIRPMTQLGPSGTSDGVTSLPSRTPTDKGVASLFAV